MKRNSLIIICVFVLFLLVVSCTLNTIGSVGSSYANSEGFGASETGSVPGSSSGSENTSSEIFASSQPESAGSSPAQSSAPGSSVSGQTAVQTSSAKTQTTAPVQNNDPQPQPSAWPASGAVPSPVSVPSLDGQNVAENESALIDLSYTSYGFVKAHLKAPIDNRIKMMIEHNGTPYYYDLRNDGGTEIYPLQFGNGTYTISVMLGVGNNQYSYLLTATAEVGLVRSDIPFLVPSQRVNYTSGSNCAALARQLVSGKTNNYERISAVLSYVAQHISYNTALAANPPNGYVPNPDAVLSSGKGICYDYAAVSAAMLRSLGYPTKLITGYVNNGATYHAWNEVYLSGQGWVKVMSVTLNTSSWSRIDVTFISTTNSPEDIAAYIGNGSNYVNRYIY